MSNPISSVIIELCVSDIQKGIEFYKNALGVEFGTPFPWEFNGKMHSYCMMKNHRGALWSQDNLSPAIQQTFLPVVSFDCDDCDVILQKVVQYGGRIIVPKTAIFGGEHGYRATIEDIDGNVIGLWSDK